MKRFLAVMTAGAALASFPLLASAAHAQPCPPLVPPILCGSGGQPWQLPQHPLPQHPTFPQNPLPAQPKPLPQHPLPQQNPPALPQNPVPHPQSPPNFEPNAPSAVTPEHEAPPRLPEGSGPTPPSALPHSPQGVPAEPAPPGAGPHGPSAPPNVGGSINPGGAPVHEPAGPGRLENTPIKVAPPVMPQVAPVPPARIEQARTAPPVLVNALAPPPPRVPVDFGERLNAVSRMPNVSLVTVNNVTMVRPAKWQYLGYGPDRTPYFYNPYPGPINVRYFYGGAYRMLPVAPGARVLLDAVDAAVFPYTVIGDDFVASGLFNGGGYVPPVWDDVEAFLPAYNQSVLVDQVTLVGHDDTKPFGQQDTFMLDDSTLGWGSKTDDGHITINRTQPTPGVGPTDDGGSLLPVQMVAKQTDARWPWAVAAAGAAGLAIVGSVGWMVGRRRNGYGRRRRI
jgi:hypothetical protein